MSVEIKLDHAAIAGLERAAQEAALAAMETLRSDLYSSETMPYDNGDMQKDQTFVAKTEEGAALVTGSPQARRLYYHPEYNFQQGHNHNAGAGWLEPYVNGSKQDLAKKAFEEEFKKRSGV